MINLIVTQKRIRRLAAFVLWGWASAMARSTFFAESILKSARGIFVQAAGDNPLQFRRGSSRLGLVSQDGRQNGNGGRACECGTAGDQFVENRTEGEDILAGVDRFRFGLFGRHIAGGPDDHPRFGSRCVADAA